MTQSRKNANNQEIPEKLMIFQQQESHLIGIVAYELWNPLSTIQICLETLANQSSIDLQSRQIIIDTAIQDIKDLRLLIQDCIDFSQFESVKTRQLNKTNQVNLQKTINRLLEICPVKDSLFLVSKAQPELLFAQEYHAETFEHIYNNFIAIVGHELRTPLCTIQICLESIIQEEVNSTEYAEYNRQMLDIALHDLERLKKLIEDFFILARLQQGQLYYRQEYIDIQTVLDLAIAGLKIQNCDRLLPKINLELPLQLPKIKTDGDRLIQATTKVLDNACKFTQPQGTIKVKVQLIDEKKEQLSNVALQQNHLFLEIIVSDTGRGISPHNLHAIFNCFYQEENALKRTVNGVGIGLAICYQIIQNLGGKIWADSAGKEQGSSIHFTVPVTI